MARHHIDSSALSWYDYDPRRRILMVEFLDSGDVYAYLRVPQRVVDAMAAAPSVGSHFTNNVRNGPYEFVLVKRGHRRLVS